MFKWEGILELVILKLMCVQERERDILSTEMILNDNGDTIGNRSVSITGKYV